MKYLLFFLILFLFIGFCIKSCVIIFEPTTYANPTVVNYDEVMRLTEEIKEDTCETKRRYMGKGVFIYYKDCK